jgi:signal transduction histidine kinase
MAAGRRTARSRPTVRTRILATVIVASALGMTIAGLVSYQVQRAAVLAQVDLELRDQFDLARHSATAAPPTSVDAALAAILSVMVPPRDGGAAGVVDGRVAYLPGIAEGLRLDRVTGLVAATSGEASVRLATFESGGRLLRYLVVPIRVAGDSHEGRYVAAVDLDRRLAGVNAAALAYAVVSAAVVAITAALGWFVAGRLLAPIRRLREAADRITVSDLDERIEVDGRDDMSRLTATVNGMLDRIRGGVEQQRSLLADVRHDLRAPLTLLRGHLELVDERDVAEVRSVRRLAIEEIDRMARMLEELARVAELGLPAENREVVDAGALAHEVAERVRGIPGPDWSLGRVESMPISIDRDRVIEAWLQVADNAARHTPEGTAVEISATVDGGFARLSVTDRGPGVPAEERERIFLRGERGAAATADGTGLGLAIVAAIARAHGGRAEVADVPGGGADVGILIPLATEAAR